MGSLENYFGTVDNPAYDPDGEEPALSPNANGSSMVETPVFKEEKVDNNKLPHQIKFSRRRSISRPCIIIIAILTLVLVGIAIGVYFVVTSSQFSPIEINETHGIEGSFKILNREFTSGLENKTSKQYDTLSRNISRLVMSIFPNEGSTVEVSHVTVKDLKPGSIIVVYHVVFLQKYNTTYAETQTEEMFFLKATESSDGNIKVGLFVIERNTITFDALPLSLYSMLPATSPTTTPTTVTESTATPDVTSELEVSKTTVTTEKMTSSGRNITTGTESTTAAPVVCEPITLAMCMNTSDQMPYTSTVYPNLLEHKSQEEVEEEAIFYSRFVGETCHPYMQRFACSLLTPKCGESSQGPVALPPCRRFCEG